MVVDGQREDVYIWERENLPLEVLNLHALASIITPDLIAPGQLSSVPDV